MLGLIRTNRSYQTEWDPTWNEQSKDTPTIHTVEPLDPDFDMEHATSSTGSRFQGFQGFTPTLATCKYPRSLSAELISPFTTLPTQGLSQQLGVLRPTPMACQIAGDRGYSSGQESGNTDVGVRSAQCAKNQHGNHELSPSGDRHHPQPRKRSHSPVVESQKEGSDPDKRNCKGKRRRLPSTTKSQGRKRGKRAGAAGSSS